MRNKRLSYSEAMSTLAIFISLGGTAVAVTKVTGRNVVNSSLTGRDLKNHSVGAVDLKKGLLPASTATPAPSATSTPTITSSATPTPTTTPAGPYTKFVTRVTATPPVDTDVAANSAVCKPGEFAVGGGVQTGNPTPPQGEPIPVVITHSGPDGIDGQISESWQGEVRYTRQNPNQQLYRPIVSVICASR